MKQVFGDCRNGRVFLEEVPVPAAAEGCLLIRTQLSLISPGTERQILRFGRSHWLDRIRENPDKWRRVLDKIKTDGILSAVLAVREKLRQPMPMGYCQVGVVESVGPGVTYFRKGDRVLSNGPHAQKVCVREGLCAKIPDSVTDRQAVSAVLGAVALEAVRLGEPDKEHACAVLGLGLIGLWTVRLLKQRGCRVVAYDPDPLRLSLAQKAGAETEVDASSVESKMDFVFIAASATDARPVHLAAKLCRRRGKIILIGVADLRLSREDFYRKELEFQVSCAYGSDRYEAASPAHKPSATVRENFEEILSLISEKSFQSEPLITHVFSLDQAPRAYELLMSKNPLLGILLDCSRAGGDAPDGSRAGGEVSPRSRAHEAKKITIGCIGAGEHAVRVLFPLLRAAGVRLKFVASKNGVSAHFAAKRFGFEQASGDPSVIFSDPEIQAVVIATRHDSHASLACRALEAGKSVYVEKPLAMNGRQLKEIEAQLNAAGKNAGKPVLTVGFNRRFSPLVSEMKALLGSSNGPLSMVMTINAGAPAIGQWTEDPAIGGGRLLGELCHFIDLARYLAGCPIARYGVHPSPSEDSGRANAADAQVQLFFKNGSSAMIHYLSSGHRSFPKERIEVFSDGKVLQLDNFRTLSGYGWPNFKKHRLWRQDKGHAQALEAFLRAAVNGVPPVSYEEILEVSRCTLDVAGKDLI